MEYASFTTKVRLLRTEVMEALMEGCATRKFGQAHFADLRMAHDNLVFTNICFQRRQYSDHLISTDRQVPQHNMNALRRHAANATSSLRGPYNGRPRDVRDDSWWGATTRDHSLNTKELDPLSSKLHQQGIETVRGVNGEPSYALFGVETVLWPKATKKSGNWYREVVNAADGFMAR